MGTERLARLAADAAGAPTPRAALRKLSELRRELDAFERRQVGHALADGTSFAAIARDLGLSRQAVHRRFRALASEEAALLMTADVRRVLRYAREEAAAVRAQEPGGDHVLLAVLRAGIPAAAPLEAAGVTLDRARTQIHGVSPRGRLFARGSDVADPRALLASAASEARARGGHRIEVEHLLVGTLGDAAGTLRALGADPDAIRAELTVRLESRPPRAPRR